MSTVTMDQALQIALQCHQGGRLAEAEHVYRQILANDAGHPDALHYLGVLAHQTGRTDLAIDMINRAITRKPNDSDVYSHLSAVLCAAGRASESIAAARKSIDLRPDNPDPYYNLGNALKDSAKLDSAIAAYRKAIELRPSWFEAHNNLITSLLDSRQHDQALIAAEEAAVLFPDSPDILCSLGRIFRLRGKLDEAVAVCRRAVALNSANPDALSELGLLLQQTGHWEDATAAYRRALELNPTSPEAHFNLANLLLLTGNFEQGWKEYEWRWKMGAAASWTPPDPPWDGSDLAGRTILLHREQGFGDLIQFIRYVPMIANRGGNIVLVCPPELRSLLAQMPGISKCLVPGEPLPHIDCQCPVMSLPLIFNTTLDSIPATVPYLRARSDRVDYWQRQFAGDTSKIKVGLVWAGRSNHANDANRSMPLAFLAPLAGVPGVGFYSLQVGEPAKQTANAPPAMKLTDRTAELTDFAETAAFIENLDLVISVDTAVVHLTGAVGKPVWTMLPFDPDCRWLLHRSDTPWYPTMRLFRQPERGDWASVIHEITLALRNLPLI